MDYEARNLVSKVANVVSANSFSTIDDLLGWVKEGYMNSTIPEICGSLFSLCFFFPVNGKNNCQTSHKARIVEVKQHLQD